MTSTAMPWYDDSPSPDSEEPVDTTEDVPTVREPRLASGTYPCVQRRGVTARNEPCPETGDLVARVVRFLYRVARSDDLAEQVAAAGYTPEVHVEGWRLLQAAAGGASDVDHYVRVERSPHSVDPIRDWLEATLRRCKSAIAWAHPEHTTLFDGLDLDVDGPVETCERFLDRIDALERGDRGWSAYDRAAMQTLCEHGLRREERWRVRELIDTASPEHAARALARWYRAWAPFQDDIEPLTVRWDEGTLMSG